LQLSLQRCGRLIGVLAPPVELRGEPAPDLNDLGWRYPIQVLRDDGIDAEEPESRLEVGGLERPA
jgi:hypothetical protein